MSNGVDISSILDLSKMLIGLEIDTDQWVGKNAKEKWEYLKRQLRKRGYGEMLNTGTVLLGGILGIVRASTTSSTAKKYIDLAELALGLTKATLVVNNAFVAKSYDIESDDDELARYMGYRSGREIYSYTIDATPEICKSFIGMTKESQEKYNFKIIKCEQPPHNNDRADGTPTMNVIRILAKYEDKTIGFEIGYISTRKGESEEIDDHSYSYISVGCSLDAIAAEDRVESVIYSNYIDTIDVSKNFIKIDGTRLHTAARINVDFDIKNIDLKEMSRTISTVLKAPKGRRGYMIQGDPGTGKTVSIHKLMMDFPNTPVFWISSDAISDVKKMRSVFRLLGMFPKSIFVFDDIDGNDFSIKNQLTTTFISCIDATSADRFSGIIILTINEPQRIHHTIKNRAERIDEVILVRNPYTVDQVADVVIQRYHHLKSEAPQWVSSDDTEFKDAAEIIINNNFTHAHIASIVSDMIALYPEGYDCGVFASLIKRRVDSIQNAKMVANEDGHIAVKSIGQTTTRGSDKYK